VIHGLLHLLGYDHAKPAARRRMRAEERRLLRALAKRVVALQVL
jgi:ssRNA-specific RNase YbeY (16S rRNA maturation enzyme)